MSVVPGAASTSSHGARVPLPMSALICTVFGAVGWS